MKTQKIIVGIDYTPSSANALKYAGLLAKHANCELVLFHLYDIPVMHANSGLYFISMGETKQSKVEKIHAFAKKNLGKDAVYEVHITSGTMQDEIQALIKADKVHSVVMGLAAKTKINRFIYGSNSTNLAGKLDCPVVIVPESYKTHKVGHSILAFDNSEMPAKKTLNKIKQFINSTQSKVNVLHIATPEAFEENPATEFKIDAKHIYPVETKKAKTVVDGISKAVSAKKAHSVISISRQHSFVYRFFVESVTKEIAFTSKVPVMVVHE